ncbi:MULTISPECIES: hypothetical protein [Streptomycetaceae]|uniref:hypothetical protein n=1 Tax=Streptomycetaceae TaxID=2062 RepID=UPI00096721A0|nr:hypothetical protein [Streptomyces sp. CB02056]OKI11327.1 hypothetical protein AMK13_02635 [Streptomyces sp. CB02056]
MHSDHYAPPTTLLGLLQRGRGQGARIAAEDPAAVAELVHGCIRWDWRWDSQVDDRHLYLARLILDLELPVAPVVDLLSGDEDTRDRATGVLELLALGGSEEARRALPDRISEGDGPAPRHPAKRVDPYPDRDNAALLALLRDPGVADVAKTTALLALSLRPPEPELIPLVPALAASDGTRPLPLLGKAVDRLAGQAVPAAREWAASEQAWLAEIGFGVLAAHGDENDVPSLIAELERRWVDRSWCGPDDLARGLARFGPEAAEAVSLLRRFWLWTPHSYERADYLEALAAMGAAGMAEAYVESLWDCEARARLLGVERAPDRPYALRRIACLRDDPMEEPEVRAAAGARLAGATEGDPVSRPGG